MNKEGDGVGQTLLNVLKHPATIGAFGGAAIGGGLGYLSPDEPELRGRSALVGAGTGAALGGLGGALSSAGLSPEEAESMSAKARSTGIVRGHQVGVAAGQAAGHQAGYMKGQADLISSMPTGVPLDDATKTQMLRSLIQ